MNHFFIRLIHCFFFLASSVSTFAIGDSARVETNLDQVYQIHGLTGNGTIVAIIDRGIDYRHPDFIDENGNTRIAFIYDMLDNTGANDPDNPYGLGTIYDMAEINQALSSGNELPTMDYFGHGIATTGIAAGNGRAIAANTYQGVAYEATIIAVKAFRDGIPAFGTFPGETGFFDPNYLVTALEFVEDKVTELAMPSVTLMNLGSTGGPTDGTSKICRAMDAFTAPGRLLVCGVGDDGGGDNHAGGTIAQGDTAILEVQKGQGNLRFDLWYHGDDRFDIMVEKPDGSILGPYASPATNGQANDQFPTGIFLYHRGADVEFFEATSNRREVLMDITQGQGVFKVYLIGTTVTDGNFHATLNPGNYAAANAFLTYLQPGYSIADYASAFNVITPTDYVEHSSWTDINGVARERTGEGDKGDLWIGSSAGPTQDGRLGVDIAVPGEVLFTSYSDGTWYHFNSHNVIQDGNGFYGLQNAVSACAPLLTGVLAMMLEIDPTLDPDEAKGFLHQTARTDAFTGTVPNAEWGHGKLDALAVVEAVMNSMSIDDPAASAFLQVYPNPATDKIQINWEQWNQQSFELSITSVQGQSIFTDSWNTGTGSLNIDHLSPGMYVISIQSKGIAIRRKFVKIE